MRRTLRFLVVAVAFLPAAVGLRTDRAAAEDQVEIRLPSGTVIDLDGMAEPAEWADAFPLPLGCGVRAWVKQREGAFLFALSADHAWPAGARLMMWFAPDDAPAGARTPGTLSIEFDAVEHDRPHLIVRRETTSFHERVLDQVVARAVRTTSACSLELAFPLSLLPGAVAGKAIDPVRAILWWHEPRTPTPTTWPANIDVRSGRDVPPGLATAAGWGRLLGIEDPAQAGAFPASAWKEWIERQAELTRRGDEAHAHVRFLAEERRMAKKNEAETGAKVFDNLRWIANREPLTNRDRIAWAQALRFLNRHDAAAALFEAVQSDLDRSLAGNAAQLRAETLAGVGRHEDAAVLWDWIASRPGRDEAMAARLRTIADQQRQRAAAVAEDRARRAAEAATSPWIELVTPHGVIVVALHEADAPELTAHVLALVEEGAYVGTRWHEVIGEGYAAGGWPPTRDHGMDVPPEARTESRTVPFTRRAEADRRFGYERGAVVLIARSGDTVGGAFRILTGHRPDLAVGADPIVGHVVAGQDVVDRLDHGDVLLTARRVR